MILDSTKLVIKAWERKIKINYLDISLIFTILTCSLVTGFIFTYAVVVMPGISKLNNKDFIRAFQVTDAVIQNNQPLFILTWMGSIISVINVISISIINVELPYAWLMIAVGAVYLIGVQGTTIVIHLPLNNHLQKINIDELDEHKLSEERINFEKRWVYFNKLRTGISFTVTLLYLVVLIIR